MKTLKLLFTLCLIALLNQLAFAGDVFTETFRSEAIGRDYKYTIYVPDSYKTDNKRYPVLYLLHGAGGDENE
jgi:predicted peptidase